VRTATASRSCAPAPPRTPAGSQALGDGLVGGVFAGLLRVPCALADADCATRAQLVAPAMGHPVTPIGVRAPGGEEMKGQDKRAQGRMAGFLALWIALVVVAASVGGGAWAAAAFAVVAVVLGVTLGVHGWHTGRG